MIGDQRDVNRRQEYRNKKARHAQQPHHRGKEIIGIVIVVCLKVLDKRKRHGQRHGAAVDQHGDAPFQKLGGDDVGPLGIAYGLERRIGRVADIFLQIVGIEDPVHPEAGKAVFELSERLTVDDVVDICHADIGVRRLPHGGKFHFQVVGADLFADQGHILHERLVKALARTFERWLVLRL